jgi:Spy/CpxP family protein refolding chaperone
MKKTLLTLLAFSAVTLSATAQQKDFPQDSTGRHQFHQQFRGKHGMEMQALNLTPDQKARLRAYNENFRAQMDSLHKNENITVKEYRDQEYALRQQRKANFESMLTNDQKAKLKQLRDERIEHGDSMMDRHLDKMKTTLGLTDDQVAQMKAHRAAMQEKLVSIRDNDNLTREQKQAQLSDLKNEREDGLKKILTPEQFSKLQELKKARMQRGNS